MLNNMIFYCLSDGNIITVNRVQFYDCCTNSCQLIEVFAVVNYRFDFIRRIFHKIKNLTKNGQKLSKHPNLSFSDSCLKICLECLGNCIHFPNIPKHSKHFPNRKVLVFNKLKCLECWELFLAVFTIFLLKIKFFRVTGLKRKISLWFVGI